MEDFWTIFRNNLWKIFWLSWGQFFWKILGQFLGLFFGHFLDIFWTFFDTFWSCFKSAWSMIEPSLILFRQRLNIYFETDFNQFQSCFYLYSSTMTTSACSSSGGPQFNRILTHLHFTVCFWSLWPYTMLSKSKSAYH